MGNYWFKFMLLLAAAIAVIAVGLDWTAREDAADVLIVVGPSTHPPGTHEVAAGGRVMEHCLRQVAGIKVDLVQGWPRDRKLITGSSFEGSFLSPLPPRRHLAQLRLAGYNGPAIRTCAL